MYFLTAPWLMAGGCIAACVWLIYKTKQAGERAERYAERIRVERCEFCGELEPSTKWRSDYHRRMCYFCWMLKYTLEETDREVKSRQ